jgi:hypothetical protein
MSKIWLYWNNFIPLQNRVLYTLEQSYSLW